MCTSKFIDDVKSKKNLSLPSPFHSSSDEINLIEVLSILIRGKYIIIFCIVFAVLCGLAVSYLKPQRWTSTAVLIMPQTAQLMGIEKTLSALEVLDVRADISPNSLLSEFMRNFDSYNFRENYLVNTDCFKNLLQKKGATSETRNRLISSVLQGNISSHSSAQDKMGGKKNIVTTNSVIQLKIRLSHASCWKAILIMSQPLLKTMFISVFAIRSI